MDRLASCYFCGVAVEAPLEEYPVVPRDLRPSVDDQSTVILCPECRRKLSTIVDRIVTVATDPEQTELTPDQTQETLGQADSSPVESSREGDSILGGFDREGQGLLDVSEGEAAGGDRDGNESTAASERDREQSGVTSDERNAEEPTTDDESDGGPDHESPPEHGGETASESEASAWTSGPSADDRTVSDEAVDDEPDDDVEDDKSVHEAEDDDGKDDELVEERSFSKSSYNRVVKLLQNREFPVEIEDIATVAASAYEIRRQESREILDALVERGIVECENGQLVRPETEE